MIEHQPFRFRYSQKSAIQGFVCFIGIFDILKSRLYWDFLICYFIGIFCILESRLYWDCFL